MKTNARTLQTVGRYFSVGVISGHLISGDYSLHGGKRAMESRTKIRCVAYRTKERMADILAPATRTGTDRSFHDDSNAENGRETFGNFFFECRNCSSHVLILTLICVITVRLHSNISNPFMYSNFSGPLPCAHNPFTSEVNIFQSCPSYQVPRMIC